MFVSGSIRFARIAALILMPKHAAASQSKLPTPSTALYVAKQKRLRFAALAAVRQDRDQCRPRLDPGPMARFMRFYGQALRSPDRRQSIAVVRSDIG
jgi:hypothetical protein